mmetsp:Transcript_14177/g.29778  ORF Transcript_14177/g.29778 Transcript_14177/m.29778 type:complete len:255 (+) Transcript_14177:271-1035(+)
MSSAPWQPGRGVPSARVAALGAGSLTSASRVPEPENWGSGIPGTRAKVRGNKPGSLLPLSGALIASMKRPGNEGSLGGKMVMPQKAIHGRLTSFAGPSGEAPAGSLSTIGGSTRICCTGKPKSFATACWYGEESERKRCTKHGSLDSICTCLTAQSHALARRLSSPTKEDTAEEFLDSSGSGAQDQGITRTRLAGTPSAAAASAARLELADRARRARAMSIVSTSTSAGGASAARGVTAAATPGFDTAAAPEAA